MMECPFTAYIVENNLSDKQNCKLTPHLKQLNITFNGQTDFDESPDAACHKTLESTFDDYNTEYTN